MILPPAVRPGDVVRVVAPSGPAEPLLVWRALGWLSERYRVRFERGIVERSGYLAGADRRRSSELEAALREPDVRALLVMRGGYGASRFVHALDWSALADGPRWVVGFSDATALHVEASRVGVASLHGPNVAALGRADADARARFVGALEAPAGPRCWQGLVTWVSGRAEGPLFGGNLTLLHACAAAGRLRVPAGAVLLLEDVTEKPYRIDRMLTTLAAGGHLAGVCAVVLGDFTECAAGVDGVAVEAVLRERLESLGVPLAVAAPFGHGRRNEAFALGMPARLEAEARRARLVMGVPLPS
ncbi:MAG: LD-carboxypeptidase [Myxococcales bacterium]|nr:LD-carboxypeptidase [Myxococcales bacterium]